MRSKSHITVIGPAGTAGQAGRLSEALGTLAGPTSRAYIAAQSLSPETRSNQVSRPSRVVVDVMPKSEILDPQGQAIVRALPALGFTGIAAVRQGKRFEIDLAGEVTDDALAQVRRAAETLLANPVIEDFTVRVCEVADPAEAGT